MISLRWALVMLLGLAGSLATGAAAQAETTRSMMLELHTGSYMPSIDDQFETATPYADVFGSESVLLYGMHLDRQIYQGFGTLAVGAGIRYGQAKGKALLADGTGSTDPTRLRLMPLTASLVYRFDWLAQQVDVPVVPFFKGGMTYTLWWILNGRGEVANAWGQDGVGHEGQGGTMGWHGSVGMQLLLDWFDSNMATEFDTESGVNNSFLFAEYAFNQVNDSGSSTSMELSAETLSFGMMFEF